MGKKKKTTNRDKLMDEKIDEKINGLEKEIKEYIKDKGIMENEKVGKKIDVLIDNEFNKYLRNNEEFFRSLKGNGSPSVNERLRCINRNIRRLWCSIVIMMIFLLGGEYGGVSIDSVKERLGIKTKEVIKEEKKEDILIIEEDVVSED